MYELDFRIHHRLKAGCSPGLGLEKHPPMVGPGVRDVKGEGGREEGEGWCGQIRGLSCVVGREE